MPDDLSTAYFCHRCGKQLRAGEAEMYIVRIEAFADPTPPNLDAEASQAETRREIAELVKQLESCSAQELADQVHRRLTLHLCTPCYNQWIENPAETGG